MEPTIDLIRHGEPQGGRRYRGQTDHPLTERGWDQMWAAVGRHRPWTRIVTSPLIRCAGFADALGQAMGLGVERDPDLMEVGYGTWSGRSPEELRREDPEGFAAFRRDPWRNRPEGAEAMEDFTARVLRSFEAHRAAADGPLLIVAHAGVLRTVIADALLMPLEFLYRIQVPYAGRVRLTYPEGYPRISHLAPFPPEREDHHAG